MLTATAAQIMENNTISSLHMQKEFDVIKNHSPLPVWNEELIIKERFSSLVKTDNLLLFELLDVSSGLSGGGIIKQNRSEAADNNDRRSTNSTNRRPKRVAWAFLKPLSTNITDPKPNTDSMVCPIMIICCIYIYIYY